MAVVDSYLTSPAVAHPFELLSQSDYDPKCEIAKTELCDVLASGKVFWELTTKFAGLKFFDGLVVTSCLVNTFFFFVMWRIKELQVHPMKLFMLITACDAIKLNVYYISGKTCDLGLQKLFMWTAKLHNDCDNELRSLQILINATAFFVLFASVFGLCL